MKGGKDKSKQIKVIKMVSIVIHFLCLNNNISDNTIIIQMHSRLKKLCKVLCKGRLSQTCAHFRNLIVLNYFYDFIFLVEVTSRVDITKVEHSRTDT